MVSIEHADFDGIERIAAVTGGEIASTFDRPELVALGECALIDEIMVRARTQRMSLPASFRLPLGGALYRRHPTLHVSDHASDVSLAPLSLPLSLVWCCVQVGEDRLIQNTPASLTCLSPLSLSLWCRWARTG